jgi:hypothetical protein
MPCNESIKSAKTIMKVYLSPVVMFHLKRLKVNENYMW